MRTLQLTHEQIEIIEKAMIVAERAYNELFERTVKVDGSSEATKMYFNKANELNDLRLLIGRSELDV